MNSPALQVRPAKPEPLAQVEVLMLFHPVMQSGGAGRVAGEVCGRATQGWLTLDVHGHIAKSEFTGRPTIEDMRLEAGGQDVEAVLPDSIVQEIVNYVCNDN